MKEYLQFNNRVLVVGTSWLASTVLVTSPSQAATLAASQGSLLFTDLSQSPVGTFTNTKTNTITKGLGGSVVAQAEANVVFQADVPLGLNYVLSLAEGENKNYSGMAESEGQILGTFEIDANSLFSFDFLLNLNLLAEIDHPVAENASSKGDIYFELIDTENNAILDYFYVSGDLSTYEDTDFLKFQASDNVTLSDLSNTRFDDDGDEKYAKVFYEGSVNRYFTNKTTVNLIGVQTSKVRVSAPENSSYISLLFSFGLMGVLLKLKRRKTTPICSSAEPAGLK